MVSTYGSYNAASFAGQTSSGCGNLNGCRSVDITNFSRFLNKVFISDVVVGPIRCHLPVYASGLNRNLTVSQSDMMRKRGSLVAFQILAYVVAGGRMVKPATAVARVEKKVRREFICQA